MASADFQEMQGMLGKITGITSRGSLKSLRGFRQRVPLSGNNTITTVRCRK